MKNQHSRILAWLLVFSMVLAMMPAMLITASADEPASAATWAKTDLKDIKSTDTVAITMTRGEVTYALPTTIDAEKKVALALVCTVKDNTLTMSGTDAQYGWHITAAEGSDGYYITTGENYLSLSNTAKGVVIGVIGCVTILPSMILTFDRALEKTMHKEIMPAKFDKLANFVVNHAWLPIIVFLVLLFPAIYGYNHTNVYYNLTDTFPESTACSQANKILEENFDMNSVYMILADTNMTAKDATKMLDELENVEGVSFALGYNSLAGTTIPDELVPDDLKDMLKGNKHQMIAIGSDYKLASDEINNQISTIDAIAKKYDQNSMVIGEAPCTKDLITITDKDFKTVSAVSIVAIFIIIFCVFKSVSLPIILVAAIEFAIFINMGLPYYLGTTLPFIASVVIGTIQLGATVDYAILMTTRYKKERNEGAGKKEAIATALSTSIPSIIVSALGFFAATFGVGAYSSVDMVASLCKLMSRGAIISMFVVIFVLPSFFVVFDKVIRYTSIGFGQKDKKEKAKNVAYASTDTYSK